MLKSCNRCVEVTPRPSPIGDFPCRPYSGRCSTVIQSKYVAGSSSDRYRLEAKMQRLKNGIDLLKFYNIDLTKNCKEMIYDVYCHYYFPACDLTTSYVIKQPVCKESCVLFLKTCKKELEIGRTINNSPFDIINCIGLPRKNAGESPVCYHHPKLNSEYDVKSDIALYCPVLPCSVLYCPVLPCIALYCPNIFLQVQIRKIRFYIGKGEPRASEWKA